MAEYHERDVTRHEVKPYFSPENIAEPFRRLFSLLNSMGLQGRNFALSVPAVEIAAEAADSAYQALMDAAKKKEEELEQAQLAADVTAKEQGSKTVAELMEEEASSDEG